VLLVFLGFFGIVEELWKIAEREPLETFGWISGLLFALTVLYLVLDAGHAVSRGCSFSSWSEIRTAAAMPARRWKRPLDATPPGLMEQTPRWGRVEPLELTFPQRVNAIAVVLAYEALVFVPVAIAAFWLFYGLGHLVVDAGLFYSGEQAKEQIALWNAKPFGESPWTKVSLLMAGFAVLYLSVHVTGQEQRELFLKVPDRELRRCFAIAAAYRNLDGSAITVKTRRAAPRSSGEAYG
jgi:hypothetical protein